MPCALVWSCFLKGLEFVVEGQRKKGKLKRIWKEIVEESVKVDLSRRVALCQSRWIVGINWIATRFG